MTSVPDNPAPTQRDAVRAVLASEGCEEALEWLQTYPADTPLQRIWNQCQITHWMAWWVVRTCGERRWRELGVSDWEDEACYLREQMPIEPLTAAWRLEQNITTGQDRRN